MGSRRNASASCRGVSLLAFETVLEVSPHAAYRFHSMRSLAVIALLAVGACGKHVEHAAPPGPSVAVTIAGTAATWGPEVFAKVPHHTTPATSGEPRDVWSLRDLVRAEVGPAARVVAVTGSEGRRAVDAASWSDAAHAPVLHTTRRGTLKFRLEDATGTWGPAIASDVTAIEIVRE